MAVKEGQQGKRWLKDESVYLWRPGDPWGPDGRAAAAIEASSQTVKSRSKRRALRYRLIANEELRG